MTLVNQSAQFRIRDAYLPDGKELAYQIYADRQLRGRIIDITCNDQAGGKYALVEVPGVDTPCVVPLASISVDCDALPADIDHVTSGKISMFSMINTPRLKG